MAKSNVPTLYGQMELSLTEAEKRLAKFTATLDKQMGTMERRTAKAAATMQSSLAKGAASWADDMSKKAVAAGLALLSFGAVIDQTKKALDDLGDLNDRSTRSGLDPETFQAVALQAKLASVDVDGLSAALETFNKNSGMAVVGNGRMVKALQALNPALLENIRNAGSQAERLKLAADAIDQAKTSSEKAAISTALFGANMVAVFEGGSKALDDTAAKARDLGIIIDNDLVAAADDLGDRFDTATTILDTKFKVALINLAPALVTTVEGIGNVAKAVSDVIDYLRDFENESDRLLNGRLAKLGSEATDLQTKIMGLQGQGDNISLMDRADLADSQAQLDKNLATQKQIVDVINARNKATASTGNDGKTPGTPAKLPPLPSKSSGSSKPDDFAREIAQVKEQTAALDAQNAAQAKLNPLVDDYGFALAKAKTEQELLNAAQKDGKTVTPELRAQIEALAEQYATASAAGDKLKEAQDRVRESLQQSAELGKDVFGGIVQDLRDGADAGTIFHDVLDKIIDKIIEMNIDWLFDGSKANSGGGILGSLFSPLLGAFNPGSSVGSTAVTAAAASASVAPATAKIGASQSSARIMIGMDADSSGNLEPFVSSVSSRNARVEVEKNNKTRAPAIAISAVREAQMRA